MTGSPLLCLSIGGAGEPKSVGQAVAITDPYVPSGALSFHVKDAAGLKPGDTVLINRPATPAWVKFMGMDTLVRNGKAEHWVSGEMHTERTIKAISDQLITLDVPLADSFVFHGNGHIQPHMRWGTGLLVDNCQVTESGIDLMNRSIMGSGHGWTIGWSVAWNCVAKTYTIQQPPGSMNWAIGCQGTAETSAQPGNPKEEKLPSGIIDSPGAPVTPASLYLAQLKERLGPQALANIGY